MWCLRVITLQGFYIEFYIEPYIKNGFWAPAVVHFVHTWCLDPLATSVNGFLFYFVVYFRIWYSLKEYVCNGRMFRSGTPGLFIVNEFRACTIQCQRFPSGRCMCVSFRSLGELVQQKKNTGISRELGYGSVPIKASSR